MSFLEQKTLLGQEQRIGKTPNSTLTVSGTSGNCSRCGRKLTDPQSVARSMGPVCWAENSGGIFEGDMDAGPAEWARREEVLRHGGEIDLGVNWQYIQHDPEIALQVPQTLGVSLRFRDGLFEAYGVVTGWGDEKEIVFGSSADIRSAYRMAVNAGPQSSAIARRIVEGNRRAARSSRPRKEALVS